MHRRWSWWLAWGLYGTGLVMLVPMVVLIVLNRHAPDIWTFAEPQALVGAVITGFVGAMLAIRRPGNVIGWLLLTMVLTSQMADLAEQWAVYGLSTSPGRPGAAVALWIGMVPAIIAGGLAPTILLLVFPSGRLRDWPTRIVAALSGASLIIVLLGMLSMTNTNGPPGFPALYSQTPNPLARSQSIADPGLGILALSLCGLMSVALLVRRFRAARGIERQQYKWVMLAMTFVVVFSVADFAARVLSTRAYAITSPGLSLSIAMVPVAMGIAIVRYRLWDIDVIINRALVYLTLSASVVGIYVFIVGWLGTTFRTGGNLGFSLVATGVVAVLFQPLRERIQRIVNRYLFGERDEPYTVISRLGRRLEESLVPEAMLTAIVSTIRESLKVPYSAIAVQQNGIQEVVATIGKPTSDPVRLPLVYQHEAVGTLLIAPRTPGETFNPADRRLLDDVARQASIAVHAARVTYELQLARERLVTAREEERRRLRRDLHDGLGSRLAALNLQATALRGLIEHDPAAAQTEVVELQAQLRAAINNIRSVVHGLRPPAIDELGLLVAVQERARQYGIHGLIVDVKLPETLPALPAAVEVAIYRIVEEALTNTVKHGMAQRSLIRLVVDDALVLTIEDDGIGIDPRAQTGVGLLSMRERAEELGGRCTIMSHSGGGTQIEVRLPLNIAAEFMPQHSST